MKSRHRGRMRSLMHLAFRQRAGAGVDKAMRSLQRSRIHASNPEAVVDAGFTLTEVMVALSVLGVAMAALLAGILFVTRGEISQSLQMEMIAEAHRFAAHTRQTVRLTSISEMVFFPADEPPIAVSYPIPASTNRQGNAVLDSQGKPVWMETIVYHPWPPDDPTELRMTSFRPRDNTLTDAERLQKLETVVLDGHGANAPNGSNSHTRVLSQRQPDFRLPSSGSTYNFYAPAAEHKDGLRLGGVNLLAGENLVRFRVTDKVGASSGYGFKLDQIKISPAGLPIEAEALPVVSQSGATAVIIENPTSRWSDRRALEFPASAPGDELVVSFYNDTWRETLFLNPGSVLEKCVTVLHTDPGNVGTRLKPAGRDLAWRSNFQTGTTGYGMTNHLLQGSAARVIVRGGADLSGSHVLADGDGCRVTFRSSDQPFRAFYILDAFISEAADQDNPGPDVDDNTTTRLHFGSPANPRNWVLLSNGGTAQTVPTDFPIDLQKSYVISYRVYGSMWLGWGLGNSWVWPSQGATNRFDTYMIPGSSSPGTAETRTSQWSNREDLVAIPAVLGVAAIDTTYADGATYYSRIVDTRLSQPQYKDIAWDALLPSSDTSVAFKVRSGNQPDLSDAPDWGSLAAIETSGESILFNAGDGRYVQVMAMLERDSANDWAPELINFTVRWEGEPTNVELGGAALRGPDGGVVQIYVNDEQPVKALNTDLTVRGTVSWGPEMSWTLGLETSPRN